MRMPIFIRRPHAEARTFQLKGIHDPVNAHVLRSAWTRPARA
jgi:hypothetical protein